MPYNVNVSRNSSRTRKKAKVSFGVYSTSQPILHPGQAELHHPRHLVACMRFCPGDDPLTHAETSDRILVAFCLSSLLGLIFDAPELSISNSCRLVIPSHRASANLAGSTVNVANHPSHLQELQRLFKSQKLRNGTPRELPDGLIQPTPSSAGVRGLNPNHACRVLRSGRCDSSKRA